MQPVRIMNLLWIQKEGQAVAGPYGARRGALKAEGPPCNFSTDVFKQ